MTSLIQLNFIFYSEEPVTLAYVFCFTLFYCLDCNVNCIRDFGIILCKVFLIFFKIVSIAVAASSITSIGKSLMNYRFRKVYYTGLITVRYAKCCPALLSGGKQAIVKARVVKNNGFYLH